MIEYLYQYRISHIFIFKHNTDNYSILLCIHIIMIGIRAVCRNKPPCITFFMSENKLNFRINEKKHLSYSIILILY